MNKKLYNAPEVREINYRIDNVVMLGASKDGEEIIGDGGSTSGSGITEGDANKRNAEWGNLW
ncbi:MAG: hypothetical protein IKP43_06290 [Bacteroidaceae bacterium]|jgi:hypothetical protein|nr:hypothetical protein [Bacteroidaceae bacterium]